MSFFHCDNKIHTKTHTHTNARKSIHIGRKNQHPDSKQWWEFKLGKSAQTTIWPPRSFAHGARVNWFFSWSPTQHRTQAEEFNPSFIPDEETATAERWQLGVQKSSTDLVDKLRLMFHNKLIRNLNDRKKSLQSCVIQIKSVWHGC